MAKFFMSHTVGVGGIRRKELSKIHLRIVELLDEWLERLLDEWLDDTVTPSNKLERAHPLHDLLSQLAVLLAEEKETDEKEKA
jgi:hypothetical protein